jgi:putative acyl-CoA dehydrogenase
MSTRDPITRLSTHEVLNQPPLLEDYDLFTSDAALGEALEREGAGWAADACRQVGQLAGSAEVIALGHQANRFPPELRTFDRFGQRIDEVDFHPAYHRLMELAVAHRVPTIAWTEDRAGGHVAHAALSYLFGQAEAGVLCPMAMTYAVVPALRHQSELADTWLPRIFAETYDRRFIPAQEKEGVTFGMAMTEKQGGSDVRANTTRARPMGSGGPGEEYLLTGHKWFCSAPMSDAFLTLAQTDKGLSCFLVPRWRPDGTRNNFFIQRLKDKLGNRSNASSEIEYVDTWSRMVGEDGRGVATIIEMVHHTRLDAAVCPVGMMRQALVQAVHHCTHRSAFGKRLVEQALMRNVLADLALEVEADTMLAMRVARAFDDAARGDEHAQSFARLATAVAKYWINKRAPGFVYECLEAHGGAGYIEESMMPRLYREAPLNSIWEGSGNVICLDVLRAMHRDPRCLETVMAEVEPAARAEPRVAAAADRVRDLLKESASLEPRARQLTESLALLLQAALLVQHAPTAIADAFCAARLEPRGFLAYGTLPDSVDTALLIGRAGPSA